MAGSFTAKTVSRLSKRKIDANLFLYKTDKGVIETGMHVVPLSGVNVSRRDAPETIGTIELRLYITRQLDVFHPLRDVKTFQDESEQSPSYKRIAPTLQMEFEQNCAPLDKKKTSAKQRKMAALRPGTEPWAIFRFYYRTEGEATTPMSKIIANTATDEIEAARLEMTEVTEPHILVLDPVPNLVVGTKPQKNDVDTSNRASSSMPPNTPSTSGKGQELSPMVRGPFTFTF
jgi:hypothetical protein